MADRITSIEFSNTLGDTPASTHRPSGKVWVNSNYLGGNMRKRYWDFILAHEEGHIVLDTKSEIEADAYASVKFFNKYPLEPFDSVKALTEVLPVNTAEQKLRVKLQEARAAKFDCILFFIRVFFYNLCFTPFSIKSMSSDNFISNT